MSEIFTIGHSNHSPEGLIELLRSNGVTAVADVRSAPYSRMYPAFNREALAPLLKDHGIAYVYLGRELGARSDDPSCYEHGKVQYRRLARTEAFRVGLGRVLRGARSETITLLCAEKEPAECHRAILVARELEAVGARVTHIHADGRREAHEQLVERLLESFGLDQPDLFRSHEESIELAYNRQEARIAYVDREARDVGRDEQP